MSPSREEQIAFAETGQPSALQAVRDAIASMRAPWNGAATTGFAVAMMATAARMPKARRVWAKLMSAPVETVSGAVELGGGSGLSADLILEPSDALLRTIFQTTYQVQGLLAQDGTVLDADENVLVAAASAREDSAREDVVGKGL